MSNDYYGDGIRYYRKLMDIKQEALATLQHMKKSFILISIVGAFLSCQKNSIIPGNTNKVLKLEDVVSIASKYNLQDSVFAERTYYAHMPSPLHESFLLTTTVEQWEHFFADWRSMSDYGKEMIAYNGRRKSVKSAQEYYDLIESYPLVHKKMVEGHKNGIEGYNSMKKEILTQNCHVYLDAEGATVFIPAASDDGTFSGRRMDKP